MATMSNNQWNSPRGEGQWEPQGQWNPAAPQSAGEWDHGQAQPSAGEWNTQQGWNTGAQPQPSASDWNTQQGWNTGAQPQPPSGDWNPQQGWNTQQGWNSGATAHPSGWGEPHQQGGVAPGYEWQPQQAPRRKSALGNVFDFSFKKFALPEAAGTIFLIAIIAIGVWWMIDVITVLTLAGGPYGVGPGTILQSLIGGLARSLLYVLTARILLEGMSALITTSRSDESAEPTSTPDETGTDAEQP